MKRFLAVTVLWLACLGLVSSSVQAQGNTITDDEKAGVIAGMVMGLDMGLALQGKDTMGPENWDRFTKIFEMAIRHCHDIRCVTDSIVTLREDVKKKRQEQNGDDSGTPWDQRKKRTF